jgi:chromosome segregation and condensation protein ScpB
MNHKAADENAEKTLSDQALAVFAFAAYHQLESGEPVTRVVTQDAAGHRADGKAVDELTKRGLVKVEDSRIVFTETGTILLARVISALRETAR